MINQQKIYIDVDEEITTVIDRIHRTNGSDIALIVPQHALLLQSVVNLKLLVQEAKKYKKNIILMTRDEDGIMFAQRAGIEVQPFVAQEDKSKVEISTIHTKKKVVPKYAEKIMKEDSQQRTIMSMGSSSFFNSSDTRGVSVAGVRASSQQPVSNRVENPKRVASPQAQRTSINTKKQIRTKQKEQSIHSGGGSEMQRRMSENRMMGSNVRSQKEQQKRQIEQPLQEQDNTGHLDEYEQSLRNAQLSNGVMGNVQLPENEDVQRVYTRPKKTQKLKHNIARKQQKPKKHTIDLSVVTGTAVKGFIFGGVALVVLILFIIILPKTKISVTPKHINIDEKIELTAQTNQGIYDSERRLIPARLIEKDITFTKTFNATGSGDVKAQKAQGKITIINEYNNKPQPLVATTRFLAEDGTLFRLVNHVTVPGMKGSEPGKVEALVMADSEGSDANIGPTKFSIPGFKSGPKRDKFYATSEKAMTGGGAGGNGVAVVTEADIEKAKKEMTDESVQYIMEQITGLLRPDNEVLLEKGVTYEAISSEANVSVGTMTEQFMYEIVTHVKVLVFSEDDVLAIMESHLAKKYHQYNADQVDLQMKYENVVSNFEKESIKMTVQGIADVVTTVDLKSFKEDIIGKKHEKILKIMEDDYDSEIEKITIESVFPGFPGFIANHISRFGFMTDVFIKQ